MLPQQKTYEICKNHYQDLVNTEAMKKYHGEVRIIHDKFSSEKKNAYQHKKSTFDYDVLLVENNKVIMEYEYSKERE